MAVLVLGLAVFFARRTSPPADAGALVRQAERALAQNDFATTSRLLEQVLTPLPDRTDARLIRARLKAAQAQWEAALVDFRAIPDQCPEGANARYYEGIVRLELNRARAAEGAWLRAHELNPAFPGPLEELANLYALQLRAEETRAALRAELQLRPWTLSDLLLFVTGGATAMQEGLRETTLKACAAADPDDLESAIALARLSLAMEQGPAADKLLQGQWERRPAEPRLAALLAEARLAQNDRAGAAAVLETVNSAAGDALLWLSRGRFALEAGDRQLAVAAYREAVRLAPDLLTANYRLGQVLEQSGNRAEAQRYLDRARRLGELINHAWIIKTLPSTDFGRLPELLTTIGDRLFDLERGDEAGLVYARALELDPAHRAARAGYDRVAQQPPASPQPRRTPGPPTKFTLPPFAIGPTARAPGRTGSAAAAVRFIDRRLEAKLDFQFYNGWTGLHYVIETMGGGVAVLDYDGDGWPDLFFPQGCRLPPNPQDRAYTFRCYRNGQHGTFEDVSHAARLDDVAFGMGCAVGDYDNDGNPDLAVTTYGRTRLYHNNGDGTFSEVGTPAGIVGAHLSSSAAFADLNRDGNLDLYVVNYLKELKVCLGKNGRAATCHPRTVEAEQDVLFENLGDGTFRDVTQSSGIVHPEGKGLGIVVADLDADGWPDVYVANDTTPNFLYHNISGQRQRQGRYPILLAEQGLSAGAALSGEGQARAGMGIACADFHGRGQLDLFVTNYYREGSTLYQNMGQLSFADATRSAGLVEPTLAVLGFGAQAVDADLDGKPDLFATNGHVDDFTDDGVPWKMRPQLFHNLGGGQFSDVSDRSGEFFLEPAVGRGCARLDWDRDGKPDLVVVHQDRPVALLHNESENIGHWVTLELVGCRSNRDGRNARVHVVTKAQTQVLELCGGDGYLAANEKRLFIGLGAAAQIEALEIHWPSGQVDHWAVLPINCELLAVEGRQPVRMRTGRNTVR